MSEANALNMAQTEEIKRLREDIRKIKIIMAFMHENEYIEAHYVHSFYDEELSKINWKT